ncbi:MAG: hypothetical protein JWR00_407 [Rubritepida sp.]|nr:hypothetical protein [Rubritepida sp.]
MNHDAGDQRPGLLQSFRVVTLRDGPTKLNELLPVGDADVWEETNARWLRPRHGTREPFLLRFEGSQFLLEGRCHQPIGDGFDKVGELPFDGLQLSAQLGLANARLGSQAVPFSRELSREGIGQFGIHHFLGEHVEHQLLELHPIDGGAVGADAALSGVAGVVLALGGGEWAATGPADDLAGEQMLRTALLPELRRPVAGLGCDALRREADLRRLPQGVVDDPQIRAGDHDVIIGSVFSLCPFPSGGIGHVVAAVPHGFSDVDAIAQHPVARLGATSNGELVPANALRGRDVILVEAPGDGDRAEAHRELGEDASNDGRLFGVDFAQSALDLTIRPQDTEDPPVPVGQDAGAAASANPALDAATRLGREILQEQGVHRALHSDMERPDLALGQGDQTDASEHREFQEGSHMLLVA